MIMLCSTPGARQIKKTTTKKIRLSCACLHSRWYEDNVGDDDNGMKKDNFLNILAANVQAHKTQIAIMSIVITKMKAAAAAQIYPHVNRSTSSMVAFI